MTESAPCSKSSPDPLAEVLDEFMERLRAAGRSHAERVLAEFPEHSDRLRSLLPALLTLDAFTDAPPTSPHAGQPLGDFRLLQEIGRGGMGVVYEAEQLSLGRKVALKILPLAAVLDERQLQRFKHEAAAAAMLRHPHIVCIYSVGSERGVYYYAMELIQGQTLAQLIAARSRSVAVTDGASTTRALLDTTARAEDFFRGVAQLGVQAAEALEHAHQHGVVHRDMKPSNLMVDAASRLWITDFGLAQIEASPQLTQTGDLLGTLRYMSPEQAAGRPTMIDHRTDIYSLGATLYELATERPAVTGQNRAQILREIAETDPAHPRSLNPAMPADLETIILKCLSKEPSARYVSAEALADDLRRFMEHRPIVARQPGKLQLLSKWARRHRGIVATAAIASAVLAVGLALSTIAVTNAWLKQKQAAQVAQAQREEQRYFRYVADMQLAGHEYDGGDLSAVLTALSAHQADPNETDLRNWEWYYLNVQCHQQVATLTDHQAAVTALEFSPDGMMLATGALDGTVHVWKVGEYQRPIVLDGKKSAVSSLGWRDDGRVIAVGYRDGHVALWDVAQAKIQETLRWDHASSVHAVRWSATGRQLAIAVELEGIHGLIVLRNLDDRVERAYSDDNVVLNLDWSPDGKRIAYCVGSLDAQKRKVRHLDVQTGEIVSEYRSQLGSEPLDVDFHPDGQLLAISDGAVAPQLVDVARGEAVATLEVARTTIESVNVMQWRPGVNQLASAGADGWIRIWDGNAGTLLQAINAHEMQINSLRWSPDGSRLATASADRTVKVWDLPAMEARSSLPGSTAMALDRSGKRLATGVFRHQGVQIIDVVTGSILDQFMLDVAGGAYSIAWSPDDAYLAVAFHADDEDDPQGVIWRVADRQVVQRVPGGRFLAWSADGKRLAISTARRNAAPITLRNTGDPHEIFVVEPLTGREVARLPGEPWFCTLAWSPDGKRLASMNTRLQIQLWDAETWREARRLALHPEDPQLAGWLWAEAVNWSPDGTKLAAVGPFGRMVIWNASTGQELHRIQASTAPLRGMAWSPDGTRIATVATDLRIWDATSGRHVLTTHIAESVIWNVLWSHDGKQILVSGDSGKIHRFDASVGRDN